MSRFIDLTDQRFGRLVAVRQVKDYVLPSGQLQSQWLCRCDCGGKTVARGASLRHSHTQSCGCLHSEFLHSRAIDLKGEKFGRLKVLRKTADKKWLCHCDCGTKIEVDGGNLRGGNSKSCGCWNKDRIAQMGRANRVHGGTGTVLYSVWLNMMHRCYHETHSNFHNYGGRGIVVSKRWHSFEKFRADIINSIGYRPSSRYSIDRINNDKGYSPGNVRWALPQKQMRNRRRGKISKGVFVDT